MQPVLGGLSDQASQLGQLEAPKQSKSAGSPFVPRPEMWSLVVKDLLAIHQGSALLGEQAGEPTSPVKSAKEGESQEARQALKMVPSQTLDAVYAKIRELVKWPAPVA